MAAFPSTVARFADLARKQRGGRVGPLESSRSPSSSRRLRTDWQACVANREVPERCELGHVQDRRLRNPHSGPGGWRRRGSPRPAGHCPPDGRTLHGLRRDLSDRVSGHASLAMPDHHEPYTSGHRGDGELLVPKRWIDERTWRDQRNAPAGRSADRGRCCRGPARRLQNVPRQEETLRAFSVHVRRRCGERSRTG